MATWDEIKHFIASDFSCNSLKESPDGSSLIVGFYFAEVDRSQKVYVIHSNSPNEDEKVTFLTPIAKYDPDKSDELLQAAFNEVSGGIAIWEMSEGTRVFVLQSSSLRIKGFADASEVAAYLNSAASDADRFEEQIFGIDR